MFTKRRRVACPFANRQPRHQHQQPRVSAEVAL